MSSGILCEEMPQIRQIRHFCHARLFDTNLPVKQVERQADLSIKCSRCSRDQKKVVLARYCFSLPRWVVAVEYPKSILCINVDCLSRIADINLPVERIYRRELPIDLSIACGECKTINNFRLGGLAGTVLTK